MEVIQTLWQWKLCLILQQANDGTIQAGNSMVSDDKQTCDEIQPKMFQLHSSIKQTNKLP